MATAATNTRDTSFSANWNASATATSYVLQVATDTIFRLIVPGYNNINVGNVLTYPVIGLNPSAAYHYRVRASNAGGTSAVSNVISVTTLVPVPKALPATNVTEASFTANWDTAATATAYLLDVATDTAFTTFVPGLNGLNVGSVATWNVSGLTGATKYFYRVRATNATGTSGSSNIISLLTIPFPPVATAATSVMQTSFSANWNAAAGATAYFLQVATDSIFQTPVAGYG
ncbi:MAG TPA: fibronectin type III domain-containing protein, partial [Bacteroidota bacterium]|nr:fibronectin type III domain-containing protein [Bacteroidota bacterium]